MIKIIDNIIIQEKLGKIRRKGIDPAHFRHGLKEIGRYMAYEFADTLKHEKVEVQTPLGIAETIKVSEKDDIIVISVLRASLPFTQGIMKVFPEAQHGIIGAWREDKPPFKVSIDYFKLPPVHDKIVIIADPMLATGHTMQKILEKLENLKIRRLVIFNIISAKKGLKKLEKFDIEVYTCSIEEKINKSGYIVPGLGDAGDLAFGKPSKL
ncbi:MAG TPA: uracil phosphoribosyltransferase [Methanothermobacter sp.]|nr:uracil phosphoribosyltransferase [Methanothermobacter sp. MT-2]HHW04562.1 uracil phosphoribosyltransferase [Methanothermobacter sp.]HOK72026.1 uracil phosphoribosyltransferase [Methanothermobacter sp.]HOL68339.1 uracil phosphoribosyltransferase [Methanothermobacter sp.]HPQ04097.1 uracil phosphoribosyltransferase [Methanothermobacter sp.]